MPVSQTQEEQTSRPAAERAEELLGRMGRGLGIFAASTSQRIQHAASTVREKAEQRSQAMSTHDKKPGQSKAAPPSPSESREASMEKADELVSLIEFRLGRFASSMNRNIQKTAARVREEAEDMWAEAQHIRSQNRQKPH
jgi:hypothetical protein